MNKYSALFEDEDDVFLGSPESKFMDVLFNANNDVVRGELGNFIKRVATMEMMLEEHVGDDITGAIKMYDAEHFGAADEQAKNLFIELMGNILSRSE